MPLVANDKSWAICMPKKTASQSLVGMCEGIATVIGEYHDFVWDGVGKRYMVVRNPKERLASMYWFSLKESSFCYGPGNGDDWLERFVFELNHSKINEWTITQSEMALKFKPDKVFKLEENLQDLIDLIKLNIPMQYRNITKDKYNQRKSFSETFTKVPDEIKAWLIKDAGEWY